VEGRGSRAFRRLPSNPRRKTKQDLSEEWLNGSCNPVAELAEEFEVTEELMRKRLDFEGVLVFKRLTYNKLKQRG